MALGGDQKLNIVIAAQDKASKVIDGVKKQIGGLNQGMEGAMKYSKMFAAGIATAATGVAAFGVSAVKAAMEAQVEMARFDATMKNIPNATNEARDAILSAAKAATKLAFDDEEAANVMAKLFQRTGDVNKAIELNALAMDLARAKGVSLAEAGDMIGLVMSGAGRALKQYGIEIDDTLGPMAALEQLQGKVAGQADAFGGTFQGKMDAAKIAFTNLKEAVGDKLLPVVTKLAEAITKFATETMPNFIQGLKDGWQWLKDHELVMGLVAGALAGLLIPALISLGVTIWTSIIPAIAAMAITMAPFLIGGAIIGGLVAGILWLVKNWDMVSARIKIIWEGIKGAFKDSVNFLIGLAEGFANAWVKSVNFVIGALNKIQFSIPSWVPGIGGKSFGINIALMKEVKLPRLEHGGIVPGARGTAVPIMAHGQERITPAGNVKSDQPIVFNFNMTYPQFKSKEDLDVVKSQINEALRDVIRIHKLQLI